jgi:hypothetical protein
MNIGVLQSAPLKPPSQMHVATPAPAGLNDASSFNCMRARILTLGASPPTGAAFDSSFTSRAPRFCMSLSTSDVFHEVAESSAPNDTFALEVMRVCGGFEETQWPWPVQWLGHWDIRATPCCKMEQLVPA